MANKDRNILVVDDLEDWRSTIGGVLEDEGYSVSETGSADKALRMLAQHPFDLTVVDVRLDETDEGNTEGIDLAKRIRARWPGIKIILITGYGTTDIVAQAFARNKQGQPLVNEYVPKTETEELIKLVRKVLAQ